jgi:hypothetical protein
MTNSKSRTWIAGTVVLSLLISLAGWFLLIDPKRAEAAELQQQALDTQASNQQLRTRISQLEAQFAELPQRRAELAEVRQAMPEDPALPTLIRDLDAMAASTGVTLMSLTPSEPVALTAPAAGAAATEAPAGTGSLVLSVPVSLVLVGDFFRSETFLRQLQADMTRAFLVQGLTVQTEKGGEASGGKPATKNGDVTMTVTGSVFVLRDAAAAAPSAPAAGTPADSPAADTAGQPSATTTTS